MRSRRRISIPRSNTMKVRIEIQPMWPEGWFNLGMLYAEQNDFAYAADRMRHYLELASQCSGRPGRTHKDDHLGMRRQSKVNEIRTRSLSLAQLRTAAVNGVK